MNDLQYRGTSDDKAAAEYGLPTNDIADVWDTFGKLAPADLIALRSYMMEKYEQMRLLIDDEDEKTAAQARIFGEWHWARATCLEAMVAHLTMHGPGASRWGDLSDEEQEQVQISLASFSERTRAKIQKAIDLERRDRRIAARFHELRDAGCGYEEALFAVAEEFNGVKEKTVEKLAREFPKRG